MSKQLLLGDEAIAQAALDAGLSGVYALYVWIKRPSPAIGFSYVYVNRLQLSGFPLLLFKIDIA